jgi:uncharacterized protein (TIGR02118 family)
MIKVIALLKRKPGLTHEEFSKYWFEKHGPFARSIAPKEVLGRCMLQNHAIVLKGGGEPPYDAVGEIYFDDMAAIKKWRDWYNGPKGKPLRDDEENFLDISKRVLIITDERVVRGRRIPDPEV